MLRADLDYFCQSVFGSKYAGIKGLIYPAPSYRTFLIHKRNGSFRVIHEPRKKLKALQLKLLTFLSDRCGPIKPCVHGFVKDRSIVTNARKHLEASPRHLLNLDLEDFFPSINFFRVRGVFAGRPFYFSHEVATVLAQMCTFQNSLPQGAPTSPAISNLVCRSLDRDLIALARRHRSTYSRYADDLTFSFSVRSAEALPVNVCSYDSGTVTLGTELKKIIEEDHHFRINQAKTRLSTRRSRMEVTGIKINEFLNVRRKFIDKVRGALHAWERYGYISAQSEWEAKTSGPIANSAKRPWNRQTRLAKPPRLEMLLWGQLLHIRMVRGKDDVLYTKLADRYNTLVRKEKTADPEFAAPSLPVEKIVRNSEDAERAVFVIEWLGDYTPPGSSNSEIVQGQGTALAFSEADTLITCDHVLRWVGEINGKSEAVYCDDSALTLHSLSIHNPVSNVNVNVVVAHRDPGRDLAVLKVVGESPIQRHFVAVDSDINKNQGGALIGYPNWSPGRPPNIVDSRVLNRFTRSGLKRFEISTLIRQGNSGGPFVDSLFRVAGVAQQGATQQSGNDECLCFSEVSSWLAGLP